jgi:hypothetical protein
MSTPSNPENQPRKDDTFTQEIQVSNVGALVPEKVARGVFATHVLVIQGQMEFVLDFLLRMNRPHQIVARVILPINLVPGLIDTLKANLENYRKLHGGAPTPAATPGAPANPATPAAGAPATPPANPPPSIEDIYHDLKMTDDVMTGAYANMVMIVHNAHDFCLEFISKVYPRPVITARVFLSAPQVPILLNSITQSWQSLQAKRQQQQPPPPRPA